MGTKKRNDYELLQQISDKVDRIHTHVVGDIDAEGKERVGLGERVRSLEKSRKVDRAVGAVAGTAIVGVVMKAFWEILTGRRSP